MISEAIARLENVEADRANALRELGKVLPTLAKPARKRLNQAEKQYQGERKRMMQLMEVIRSDAEWVK